MMNGPAPQVDPTAAPSWQLPAGWTEQAGNSVRVATLQAKSADGRVAELAITQFPGDVGGDLANVNRWRGQIGLPALQANELAFEHLDAPGGHFDWVDLQTGGPKGPRILGAWLKQPERTWFFKFTGEHDVIAEHQSAFFQFIGSLRFADPATPHAHAAAPAPPASSVPPASLTPAPQAMVAAGQVAMSSDLPPPPETGADFSWTAPTSWKPKALGAMRKGSFTLEGPGGEADLSIIVLPGAAGGLLDNVNRWRGQVGLAPWTAAELSSQARQETVDGKTFTVVDLASTSGGQRILGAITTVGPLSYFLKITGPDSTVAAQQDNFLTFLQTVRIR